MTQNPHAKMMFWLKVEVISHNRVIHRVIKEAHHGNTRIDQQRGCLQDIENSSSVDGLEHEEVSGEALEFEQRDEHQDPEQATQEVQPRRAKPDEAKRRVIS